MSSNFNNSNSTIQPQLKKRLRGVIHCHSRYSYDSVISIRRYLRFAEMENLDFIVLTDHDTIEGALALQRAAAASPRQLEVPIAAEYHTDCGDLIALFLQSELSTRNFSELCSEARLQGAVLLLPHPFVGHKEIDRLCSECDLVEVFNSRASERENQKAYELAARMNKRAFAASDCHLARSLGRVIVEVENCGSLKESLLCGEINWIPNTTLTPLWEKTLSQGIKALKKRDLRLGADLMLGTFRYLYRGIFGRSRASNGA